MLSAALLIMPLHGVAAYLSPLLCDGDSQGQANVGQDFDARQSSGQGDGGTSSKSAYHPCHNTVLAPLVAALLTAAPEFPVRAIAPDIQYDPFIPQQPQRPPLV